MLNKASNFDHKYDISFSPIQYILNIRHTPSQTFILEIRIIVLDVSLSDFCSSNFSTENSIQNIFSEHRDMCEVQQGTVLGPILFLMHLNNIFTITNIEHVICYTDDTALLFSSDSWIDVRWKEKVGLLDIKKLFDYNPLFMNN